MRACRRDITCSVDTEEWFIATEFAILPCVAAAFKAATVLYHATYTADKMAMAAWKAAIAVP